MTGLRMKQTAYRRHVPVVTSPVQVKEKSPKRVPNVESEEDLEEDPQEDSEKEGEPKKKRMKEASEVTQTLYHQTTQHLMRRPRWTWILVGYWISSHNRMLRFLYQMITPVDLSHESCSGYDRAHRRPVTPIYSRRASRVHIDTSTESLHHRGQLLTRSLLGYRSQFSSRVELLGKERDARERCSVDNNLDGVMLKLDGESVTRQ
ncbi:hypothetical protein Tco_0573458 [Tanacetum coccineum]